MTDAEISDEKLRILCEAHAAAWPHVRRFLRTSRVAAVVLCAVSLQALTAFLNTAEKTSSLAIALLILSAVLFAQVILIIVGAEKVLMMYRRDSLRLEGLVRIERVEPP